MRTVNVPRQFRSLLQRRDQNLAQSTKQHIEKLAAAQRAISGAIMTGLSAYHTARHRSLSSAANVATHAWFLQEDSRFFDDLWEELAATDRTEARGKWLQEMLDRAMQAVRAGCDAIPRDQTYWAAQAKAEHFFRAVTWKMRE